MAELSIPYVRRQLSRSGSSGGGGGGIPQPRLPDASGLPRQQAQAFGQVGDDLNAAAGQFGDMVQRKQKARDVAMITQLEATVDEQVAFKAQELLRDARIHPFDYREQLQAYRDGLLQNLDVPDRIKGLATAKVQASTSKYLIDIDAQGTKRGVEQALATLDLRADQLIRKQVEETDPAQRGVIDTQLRDLYSSYVDGGIITNTEAMTRMQKTRDQSAVYQVEQAIRLNPDAAVEQLEKGLGENMGIPPDAFPKLLDRARQVQRERFEWGEQQEAKVRRDTKIAQEETEAVAFGRIQKGQLNRASLDAMLKNREISGDGYQTMVRYMDTKAREDRSEARAKASLGLQYQERRDRQTEAQLSILATTGQLDVNGIIAYAGQNKLPATAIDGAIAKAKAHETAMHGIHGQRQSQAEQMLDKAMRGEKGPLESLLPEVAPLLRAAFDELTDRSIAYASADNPRAKEDPIAVVQEILPKYMDSLSEDKQVKLDALLGRLKFASPHELNEAQGSIPPTIFREQQKLFKEIDTLMGTQKRLDAAMSTPERATGSTGPGLWERIFGGSSAPAPDMTPLGRPKGGTP